MAKNRKKEQKSFDVKKIMSPMFLRDLDYNELNVLSSDIRNYIIDVTSRYGGHLSSNLGVVELTIALHRVFDFSKDKLIFDVGHQCYTHKILTGRSLEGFRNKDAISGFQKVSESIYDVYEAGHSSTSISAANGFAIARDAKGLDYDVVAFIGDSALASGLALEGLNNASQGNHKVIIILNDNDMSITRPVGGLGKAFRRISTRTSYNRFKTNYKKLFNHGKFGRWIIKTSGSFKDWIKRHLVSINIFDEMGYKYIGPIDGHNIKKLEKALKLAKSLSQSVVVHVNTTKGKGYSFAENDVTGYWHGVGPFDIETGLPKDKKEDEITWSKAYATLVEKEMSTNENLYLLSPATESGSALNSCYEKYKSRCIDVGICEEHCVTLASGLSINGYHPIISIYSTFMQRAFDEISHDLARMNLNATFLVDRSGLVGKDGETHQGLYDESFLFGTPNCTVTMASNYQEAASLLKESLNNHGPYFIRLPRMNLLKNEMNEANVSINYGEWIYKINNNSEYAIVGSGPILEEVSKLAVAKKLNIDVINALYLKPMDEKVLSILLNKKKILVFDAYSTNEGFINSFKSYLLDHKYNGEVKSYSVALEFVKQATVNEQLEKFELTPNQLIENSIKFFNI